MKQSVRAVSGLICGALVMSLCGCGYTSEQANLRQQVAGLERERAALRAQVQTLVAAQESQTRAVEACGARERALQAQVNKFKAMLSSGKLNARIEGGRMLLTLPSSLEFAPGRSELSPQVREDLRQVTAILSALSSHRVYEVLGHADSQEAKPGGGRDAWELSAQRALGVTRFMVAQGMEPGQISAAGLGSTRPLADNATVEGRGRNRRVEIALLPDLSLESPPELSPVRSSADDDDDDRRD